MYRCMGSAVNSGAVVFIGGGCVHRCSKYEMFFLVKQRVAGMQLERGHVCCPGDATNLAETCYLFGENNCTRKQHTLKPVVKVSRKLILNYIHVKLLTSSPKTLTRSPKAETQTLTAHIRE